MDGDPDLIDVISEHVEEHIGKIKLVVHDNDSKIVHLDIMIVEPTKERDYFTLVTCGMSQKRMPENPSCEDCEDRETCGYCELVMCLPNWWPVPDIFEYTHRDFHEHWPLSILHDLAYWPHYSGERVCNGHSISYSDIPNAPFTTYLLTRVRLLPREFQVLNYDDRRINFCVVFPIFESELEFKIKRGIGELDALFDLAGVTELLDEHRNSVI